MQQNAKNSCQEAQKGRNKVICNITADDISYIYSLSCCLGVSGFDFKMKFSSFFKLQFN